MPVLDQDVYQPARGLTQDRYISRPECPAGTTAAFAKPAERTFIFPSAQGSYQYVVRAVQQYDGVRPTSLPDWILPTVRAFSHIQGLSDGWDSYGAKRVNHELIRSSLALLSLIMESNSPTPSVVPLTDGGVQIEWHRKRQDLEITFAADDPPQFFYRNNVDGEEEEGLANDQVRLTKLLRNIA
jgi:hypothetical protein